MTDPASIILLLPGADFTFCDEIVMTRERHGDKGMPGGALYGDGDAHM
jgi:hypothetical protein